jgi:hypothetical protein
MPNTADPAAVWRKNGANAGTSLAMGVDEPLSGRR